MFGAAYRIATVWGIPIKLHVSLLILLAALAVLTWAAGPGALLTVLALQIAVFASIALHELGHSLVAIRKGCRVREITLMFLGGVAQMESMPRRPLDEFLMAAAGPAVSFALGALCWFGGALLPGLQTSEWPVPFVGGLMRPCNIVQFLGVVNVWLGLFNLIPAFPMDGGRILRAALSRRMGRLRATRVASVLGRTFAALLALRGVSELPEGVVLTALGVFLYVAADREYRMVRFQETPRRPGAWPWPPLFGPRPPPPPPGSEGEVIIGPPPYETGRGQRRAPLREDDDERFSPPWGR